MSDDKHDYKAETKIRMTLNIGYQGGHEDVSTIGDLTGLNDDELSAASSQAVESEIEKALTDWSYNFIDTGWDLVAE